MYQLFEEFVNSQENEESKSVEDQSIEATNKLKEVEDKIESRNEKIKELEIIQKEKQSNLNTIKSTIGNSYEAVRNKNSENIKRTGNSLPIEELYSLLKELKITGNGAQQAVNAINDERELENTEKEILKLRTEITKLKEHSIKISTIINKLKNSKVDESRNSKKTIELLDLKGLPVKIAEKLVQKNWWENITYRGFEFFDLIYMDIIYKESKNLLEIGEWKEYEQWDEAEDDYILEDLEIEGDEAYLGYDPDSDTFINGWSVSGPIEENIVQIKIDEFGEIEDSDVLSDIGFGDGNFYPEGYDRVKKKFPNIIDLRLD